MDNTRQLLERLNRGEKLDSPVLERLQQSSHILARDVTNNDTPPDRENFCLSALPKKGRRFWNLS